MAGPLLPLLDRSFLLSEFAEEFRRFQNNGSEEALLARLTGWQARKVRGETEIEGAFIHAFFEETWGYRPDGQGRPEFTLRQQYPVPGAGAGGASGSADLVLGRFGEGGSDIAQVLCEFKGIGADLDRPQARKGSRRSPAEQALDYLRFARRGLFDSAPVLPRFALVTDMDQFRLYWFDTGPASALTFRISARNDLFGDTSLLGTSERDRFDRFLFWRLFQPDMLTSEFGRTRLERLIERQGLRQRRIETDFYKQYRDYRLRLYNHVTLQPLDSASPRAKLRATQKLLDRLVFLMFAEDMGRRVAFPPGMLRDLLKRESMDPFYDPEDDRIWRNLQRTFDLMNAGGSIGDEAIPQFNGGLFAADPLIAAMRLPNHLFCKRGQGRNAASIEAEKDTLLFLAATYDFSTDPEGEAQDAIGLYTLGHIFEQSIVELDVLEAAAQQRASLSEVTKRKRDGVYYTPEPIVRRIIAETIDPLLARWKAEAGWEDASDPSRTASDAYWQRLRDIRIVDPACGSGAFLISAYRYLFSEMRIAADIRRRLGHDRGIEDAELSRTILRDNIYGVDINPLSVEIAQLSLWLHSAYPREPLSRFEHTIRCGNSLISPAMYDRRPPDLLPAAARDRVTPFDWDVAFPEIAARGGFDAVIGNPPYVKLQHFRMVYEETALLLRGGIDGKPSYAATQSGNFDLYLPFIERGLRLLNDGGRMGYIAPSLWPTLEYGAALRRAIVAGGQLERWIDFRAHQVFDEATVYTAIQVFTAGRNPAFAVAFAPDGALEAIDWSRPGATITYGELDPDGAPWLLAPDAMRALIARLGAECDRLDDAAVSSAIFQGLVTSADHIYHLRRLAPGRYLHTPRPQGRTRPPAIEVAIEDAIMKPLVSGPEAKRFLEPETDTYLLFPYRIDDDGARLWSPDAMGTRFPEAWDYLRRFEAELRARDNHKVDSDDRWFGYVYPKNLDKQEQPKLLVPRLVPALRIALDPDGQYFCDNVDVGGIVPRDPGDLAYLGGILNAPTSNAIFRWLSKPFRGGYMSANRQFIAPLPIPRADAAARAGVGALAMRLQAAYSARRALRRAIDERLGRVARRKRPHEWLLPDVAPIAAIERGIVNEMEGVRRRRATRLYDEQVETALDRLQAMLRPDSMIVAASEDGALVLRIDDAVAARAYVDPDAAPFLLAQWQVAALAFEPTGRNDAARLVDALRYVGEDADPVVRDQIIARQGELSALTRDIVADEARLHELTMRLFVLTPSERRIVKQRTE